MVDKLHKPDPAAPTGKDREKKGFEDCVDFASLVSEGPKHSGGDGDIDVVTGSAHPIDVPTATAGQTKKVVRVWAPAVVGSAEIQLKKDVDPTEAKIDFGWIQTIESSQRTLLYESRKSKARASFRLPEAIRDVRPTRTSDGKSNEAVPAPWYYPPQPLTAAKRSAYVEMRDQPKIEAPPQLTSNTDPTDKLDLVGIEGGESFVSTLKIGTGENLKTLASYTWSVPWTIDLHENGKVHAGGEIANGTTPKDAQKGRNDKESPESAFDKDESKGVVPSYTTVDEAKQGLSARTKFMNDLAIAKKVDPKVYWNMVGALWQSPMMVRLKINGVDASEWPNLQVTFKGPGGSVGLPMGAPPDGWAALAHMVYAPDKLDNGEAIEVLINGQSVKSWAFPFDSKVSAFSGKYKEGGTHLWHSEKSYDFELDIR